MALIDILADVARLTGTKLTQADQRAMLVDEINNSARELYNGQDLLWCDREQLFAFDENDQQVALPYYVDKIIHARHYEYQTPVEQQDMRPRYRTKDWAEPWLVMRTKEISPLKKNILTVGPLKVQLPAASPEQFVVIITGATDLSSRISETVLINVGELEKSTVNSFSSVESIRKPDVVTYDVVIKDIEDNEVSSIANGEPAARFLIAQVNDKYRLQQAQSRLIEILYKVRFTPFKNDYDSFPCTDIYDHAI